LVSISLREYQQRRIASFLNPWDDPLGIGYQLVQSLLAIGSGGWWGRGFGFSQQKLASLPIQFTDFIFSVFAEEFGFWGSLLLIGLLVVYGLLGLRVAIKARDRSLRLVAVGSVVLLVGQAMVNIGVATGVLPTTGLPFPLISYGGSSAIASLFLAGLLVRVAREASAAPVVSLDRRRSRR
jgi:cell division protein FtsW